MDSITNFNLAGLSFIQWSSSDLCFIIIIKIVTIPSLHGLILLYCFLKFLHDCRSIPNGRLRMALCFSKRLKNPCLAKKYHHCNSSIKHSVMQGSWRGLCNATSFSWEIVYFWFMVELEKCSPLYLII